MRQTIILAILALLMVGCGSKKTTVDTQPNEVCVWENGNWATEWMQKYVEYTRETDSFYTDERMMDTWQHWGLAYINNDTIPEMLLYGSEATGCKVLTIYDGKVSEWNSWRCGVSYIPKSGLINSKDGSMGHYYDRVIKLENGKFTLVYMTNRVENFDYLDSNYVYYQGKKYSITDSTGKFNLYTNDSVKHTLYTAFGQSVDFYAIDSLYPTAFFEQDWQPTPSDGTTLADYKLTLSVR